MLAPIIHYICLIFLSFLSPAVEGRAKTTTSTQNPSPGLVPALYVFGDSLVENGNNNMLPTLAKANYRPYGVDFPMGATGRYTNGRTMADLICFTSQHIVTKNDDDAWIEYMVNAAEGVGLPYSPPYKGGFSGSNWLTGFNYASSACGILPESGRLLGYCYDFDKQIQMFNDTIERVLKKHYTNEADLSLHLSKSIVLFVIGNNDYLNNYFMPAYIKYKNLTPIQYAELLIRRLTKQLKRVYALGARKILFSEVAPIGCMPLTNKTAIHKGPCDEKMNNMISEYNNRVGTLLPALQSRLPNSLFVVARFYYVVYSIIIDHVAFGFANSKDACCKAIFGDLSCIPGLRPCKNRDKYCFWDAFHPTESMASHVVSRCFNDTSVCTPLNLQQLMEA